MKAFDFCSEVFGEMRHSTEEELQLYNQMLENMPHITFDVNIFDLYEDKFSEYYLENDNEKSL